LRQGRVTEAEALYTEGLEIRRRILGEEHPMTLTAMSNLAGAYGDQRKNAEAAAIFSKVVEISSRILGSEHPDTLTSLFSLGVVYLHEGEYAKAEPPLAKVLDGRKRVLGDANTETLRTASALGMVRLGARKYVEAEEVLESAFRTYQMAKVDNWQRYLCESLLGASLAGQKRYADAEPLLLAGYSGMLERLATIPAGSRYLFRDAQNAILHLYQDWGKSEKAAEWRTKMAALPQ